MKNSKNVYFVVTIANIAHPLLASRIDFSTNALSVGFLHFHLQDTLEKSPNRYKKPHTPGVHRGRKKGKKDLSGMRDASSVSARARMKKIDTSSSSKLLRPPSIIASRLASERRLWENYPSQNERPKKRKSSSKNMNITLPTLSDACMPNTSLFALQHGTKKGKSDDIWVYDKSNSSDSIYIPPFTSTVCSAEPLSGLSSTLKDSLKDNHDDPNSPLFEPTLFDPFCCSSSVIEGVLPVSELFYRSTQSMVCSTALDNNAFLDELSTVSSTVRTNLSHQEVRDDEELPFSAEQSDRLSTPGNKILIRRNIAGSHFLCDIVTRMGLGIGGDRHQSEVVRNELIAMVEQESEEQRQLELWVQRQRVAAKTNDQTMLFNGTDISPFLENHETGFKLSLSNGRKKTSKPKGDRSKGRKMVRRGMEMLVGGEPINADPPQRSIELNYYRKHPKLWSRAITTNSPDFGPLLHMHSAGKVGKESIGLSCEHFVHSTQKWGICPDDLKAVLSVQELGMLRGAALYRAKVPSVVESDIDALLQNIRSSEISYKHTDERKVRNNVSQTIVFDSRVLDAPKGFGAQKQNKKNRKAENGIASDKLLVPVSDISSTENIPSQTKGNSDNSNSTSFTLGGELKFSLGVSRSEVEHDRGRVFSRVLRDGISLSINADELGFDVHIAKLVIVDVDGGAIDIVVQFQLFPRMGMGVVKANRAVKEVNGALASAMDDGKMAMALAHAAEGEKGWSAAIRNRIVEEFLFETEDDEDGSKECEAKRSYGEATREWEDNENVHEYDGPFGMEGDVIYAKDDIWLGGGNGGVFPDYSESNKLNSPYEGNLGPFLVDAAVERARQNQPRVIAIGDVHGCIDELKSLLKKCDYHPGDVIVFLGDLVCKGPDSLSVVQMAREIGAIGVRGNHDFEVVRWHQAIKSGADPPVIGSEHYYVASALNTADLKWMYSLPWFISSSHLNALFVHAGFVSGIRLAKQNPRLMMNMRSILPDGTVTSKFFNNWPWARLWDGPQTVFFGHDADRGLQQYEHAIGLDTGCVYGGKLTACILPERRLVSVNAKREYFQYRRKHFD